MSITTNFPVFLKPAVPALVLVIALSQTAVCQDISVEKRGRINRVKKLVDAGGKLFKSKDYAESAKSIRDAQKTLIELAESGEAAVIEKLNNDYQRILKAQNLLESKGEKFSEMKDLDSYPSDSSGEGDPFADDGSDSKGSDSKGSDTEGSATKDSDGSDSKSDTEMVSFTKQVAPIIVQHCGQCHIDRTLGKFSAQTYESIKKGSRKGPAVRPRDLEKSRMIVLVEGGAMPPEGKGTPVAPEKLQILKDWIEQGAKFDGEKKQKKDPLSSYVSTDSSEGEGSSSKKDGSRRGPPRRGSIKSLGGGDQVPE